MGIQDLFTNGGGMYLTLIGGVLAAKAWNYTYLAFLYALIPLVLGCIYFPADKPAKASGEKSHLKIAPITWLFGAIIFVFINSYGVMGANISFIITERGMGTAALTGTAMAIFLVGGMFGGLIFNPFEKKLREYVLCCGFIALVIGFLIIYFAQSLVMLCYYPMFLVISKIVVGRGIGNSVTVGNAMVFYSVATIAGGIVFGFAEKLLKNKTMFVMLAVTGVTMLGLYFSHSFASVAAWLVVSGVFSTGIIPACISAFSESVEEENKFLATSIAESGVNIGAFLGTPYIALIEAFGGSADTAMFISPIIMLILGFVTLRFYKKDAKM